MAQKKQPRPGRPKKPKALLRGDDLRIPLMPQEKQQIRDAAMKSGGKGEMADWARSVLLEAARQMS